MKTYVRRLRGALGNALVWGACWFMAAYGLLTAYALLSPRTPLSWVFSDNVTLAASAYLPPEIGARNPFTLSSGQRRRLALGLVLASGRRLLLLDEPTAALDRRGKALVLDLLTSLPAAAYISSVIPSGVVLRGEAHLEDGPPGVHRQGDQQR